MKYSFHESSSSNGKLVHGFVEETQLFITNTFFQKKLRKLWTFISDMGGTKSQDDYIMINRKWNGSVHKCELFNSFSSMDLDDRVVTPKIKLSPKTNKVVASRVNYEWAWLSNSDLSHL